MSERSQHILFILDRSGSMGCQTNDVIGGFNTYIDEMKAEAINDGMETVVSLVTFADDHKIVFASKPIAEVKPLTKRTYRPMGSTALLDAVHDSVGKYLEKLGQGEFSWQEVDAPPVLVIVFTDGEENASTQVNWKQVQALIQRCEGLGNWTFTYVGAHANAWGQASQLHFQAGNTLGAEDMTIAEVTVKLTESSKLHRANYRDHGMKKTDDLFDESNAVTGAEANG